MSPKECEMKRGTHVVEAMVAGLHVCDACKSFGGYSPWCMQEKRRVQNLVRLAKATTAGKG